MVSPDNSLIEFFTDPEGRVIKEIDNDPNSPSFGRSLREYAYAGDKVIGWWCTGISAARCRS